MSSHSSKKTKRSHPPPTPSTSTSAADFIAAHHPEKPSARAQETDGRNWTLSIAIPGSIVLNAQSPELRGWLAGQIARTCAIFSVSEIVVYKDAATPTPATFKPRGKYREVEDGSGEKEEDPSIFLCRILEYLETPQYLRKALFPLHPSLRLAGLLPPLDCPHHLRRDDESPFREGVIVSASSSRGHGHLSQGYGSNGIETVMVDVGLWEPIEATGGEGVPVNTRVTVRTPASEKDYASLVSSATPTSEAGLYWGYRVRLAPSLAHVFSESPFTGVEGGYDISIGTSERGVGVESILEDLPKFQHLLLTLGPLSGLELTIAADPLIPLGAEDAADLFDHWVNVVTGQGSRTVRTEEALSIALSRLKTTIEEKGTTLVR